MRKIVISLAVATLTACGGGTITEPPKPQVVKLSDPTNLPVPFVVGPSGTVPVHNVPVVGPGPVAQLPFVIGPVSGPIALIDPPVVVGPTRITQPVINYCTDGFVVGPCTPLPTTCRPDASGFVIGPCSP
jgi:hypothetical protein